MRSVAFMRTPRRGPSIDGEALRHARYTRGITQTSLADRAQISPQYLCDLELGRRRGVNPEVAARLAQALDLDITEITDIEEPVA
ncbi:MAG: helix-turn-helix transcriptional regulator [Pseudonocardiaceae bacterium]